MKRKNDGFSLIEVLVAIAVLALVVGPLLHSFLTAANTNAKSQPARATTVAQNLMEQEVVALPADGLTRENGWISLKNQDTGVSYGYEKKLEGITLDNRSYHAKITLNSADYGAQNSTALADISNMSQAEDAVYVEPMEPMRLESTNHTAAQQFLQDILQNNPDSTITEEEIKEQMIRTITFEIGLEGKVSGPHRVQVKLFWTYELNHSDLGENQRRLTMIDGEKIFDNIDSGKPLRNLYLIYRPQYSSRQGNYTDRIIIRNTKEVPVTLYLVRQQDNRMDDVTGLPVIDRVTEESYQARLQVYERETGSGDLSPGDPGTGWLQSQDFSGATALRSNLGRSLTDGTEISGNSQLFFEYYRFSSSHKADMGDTRSMQLSQFKGLAHTTPREHLYSVTIEVFEDAGGDPFGEEYRLYTLKGTKEN